MDLTEDFRSIAATCAAGTDVAKVRDGYKPDLFLEEAQKLYHQLLQLQDHLQHIRKAYLSNTTKPSTKYSRSAKRGHGEVDQGVQHLTEMQRDEIDYEVKQSIREATNRVRELENLEAQRRKMIQSQTSFLSRLMPDLEEKARSDLLASHRSSITWFLNHTLLQISQRHAETKTMRLERDEERRSAIGSSTMQSAPVYAYDISRDVAATSEDETKLAVRETLLSAEQLQEFETENAQILEEFENQVSQIRSVQTKLVEIAELSSELQQHLAGQTEMTNRLMTEAEQTTLDVTQGNQQLTRAKRRNKTLRLYITTIFLVLSFTLLFLDYYAS